MLYPATPTASVEAVQASRMEVVLAGLATRLAGAVGAAVSAAAVGRVLIVVVAKIEVAPVPETKPVMGSITLSTAWIVTPPSVAITTLV